MEGWTHHGEWSRRILDYDPELRRTTYYWYNDGDKQQRLTEHYDVSAIIEMNKAQYAATDERARWDIPNDKLGIQVGRIPISIAMDVLKKTGWGRDRKAVSRWLTDPDNRHFMTRPVRKGL